jgi:hypothetical protein
LLISVSATNAAMLTDALLGAGVSAVEIGQVTGATKPLIRITA